MCFSANVSLGVGAALLPVGVYCINRSLRKDESYLPLAIVPFVFGIQQIIEGLVWVGIEGGNDQLVRQSSLGFLAFALVFWPFWMPLSATVFGVKGRSRWVNSALSLFGVGFGLYLYLPIIFHSKDWLVTKVYFHSIQYDFGTFRLLQFIPGIVWQSCYVIIVSLPFLVANRGRRLRFFGFLVAISAILAQAAFHYAFISIWCLFAAVLSLYLARVFQRLPFSVQKQIKINSQ